MNDQKQQLVERLQSATNILVTVSTNPSVDQLAACIGLTLALNKLDKHATAVFSGDIPSTIEFLKPSETIEKNTDSLQDFIIALDKSKADKLRYKVEDKVVKIFITPYRTSLSADDLEFSQGDFNVDVVLALGVHEQTDLDDAIISHGRILHDATVTSITNNNEPGLGTINWQNTNASSLSELVTELVQDLDKEKSLLDAQISTALLTGIVAATDRFRNDHTSALTMNVSADLMSAGANQQLVTSELAKQTVAQQPAVREDKSDDEDSEDKEPSEATKSSDGTLEINHDDDKDAAKSDDADAAPSEESKDDSAEPALPEPPKESEAEPTPDAADTSADTPDLQLPEPATDDVIQPEPSEPDLPDLPKIGEVRGNSDEGQEPNPFQTAEPPRHVMSQPSPLGGVLTANSQPEQELGPVMDPLTSGAQAPKGPLLSHDHSVNNNDTDDKSDDEANQPVRVPDSPAADTSSDEPNQPDPLHQPMPAQEPAMPISTTPPEPPNMPAPPVPAPWTPPTFGQPAPSPQAPPANPFSQPPQPPITPLEPFAPSPASTGVTNPGSASPFGLPPTAPAHLGAHDAPANSGQSESDVDVDAAREEVMKALSEQPNETLPPVQALNAAPLGPELHGPAANLPPLPPLGPLPPSPQPSPLSTIPGPMPNPFNQPMNLPLPATPASGFNIPPPQAAPPTNSPVGSPTLPPPVPPPMMPPPSQ